MYEYLKGEYAGFYANNVVIECAGVGYKVMTSLICIESMPQTGETVTIYTHLSVREDAMDLYGFLDKNDIDVFRLLMSVSGVGPKVALSVLSALSSAQIAQAVLSQDQAVLTSAPGIGPKVAQRMILELKDKIAGDMVFADSGPSKMGDGAMQSSFDEAVAALMALGYSKNQASNAVRSVLHEADSVEDVIKAALRSLMR